MLVSHRKKFIYTKTVKTAGTSVESYFEKYCMPEGEWVFTHHRDQHVSSAGIIGARGPTAQQNEWYNHMPAVVIRDKIGKHDWDDYFKFCVVRNPFDKLVSMFFFQKKRGLIQCGQENNLADCFKAWISKGVAMPDRDKYIIDGKVCIDYFVRFEHLEEDILSVCKLLGLPFEPTEIPKLKTGLRDSSIRLSEFYTDKTIQAVKHAYQFEINEFGYVMPHD